MSEDSFDVVVTEPLNNKERMAQILMSNDSELNYSSAITWAGEKDYILVSDVSFDKAQNVARMLGEEGVGCAIYKSSDSKKIGLDAAKTLSESEESFQNEKNNSDGSSIGFGALWFLICTAIMLIGWNVGPSMGILTVLGFLGNLCGILVVGSIIKEKVSPSPTIEEEKKQAEINAASGAPWGKKYFTYPCPYCGHYRVRYATWDDKKMSVAFWGVWSNKVGKAFKCDHCNRVFND